MRIKNLNAGYQKKIVVKDLSLEVKKGEIISLIGPNGGGKSTLLKSISGELKALGGSVFLEEEEIHKIPLKELAKKMSIVNTERVRPEHMSVWDVVLSGRLPYSDGFGFNGDEDAAFAKRACELMNIEKLSDMPFTSLSDGQKQRTLIARAICQDPEYMIMDEPTSYLDIRHRLELIDVIKKLSKENVTIIMSLHELELALEVSDRVLLVKSDGTTVCEETKAVIESGVIKELYGLTNEMYERVKKQLQNKSDSDNRNHASYFLNKECKSYPCHKVSEDKFNCMFCYCPLYPYDDCGGTYTYTSSGIKSCMDCTFPHDRDNYGAVIKKLKEKMYGKS